MFINKDINVYERDDVLSNYHDLRTKFNLVLDFDNAMPGFTILRIYDVREWKNTKWKLLPEQCYLLMILVAIHTTGV
jgi:hypothetical protein